MDHRRKFIGYSTINIWLTWACSSLGILIILGVTSTSTAAAISENPPKSDVHQEESKIIKYDASDGEFGGWGFRHIQFDPKTRNLYVGGTNVLLQLNGDTLQPVSSYATGPKLDSPYCRWDGKDCIQPTTTRSLLSPSITNNNNNNSNQGQQQSGLSSSSSSSSKKTLSSQKQSAPLPQRDSSSPSSSSSSSGTTRNQNGSSTKTMMSNVNQILLLVPGRNVLIACGSVNQGTCTVHESGNISTVINSESMRVPVAANSPNASTVAFIAPGPGSIVDRRQGGQKSMGNVIYVGATYSHPYYRDTFPSVATRSLATGEAKLLELVDRGDVTGRSALDIRAEYRSEFRVNYVGGFHHSDGFAYWATVQRSSPMKQQTTNAPYVSKLIRICDNDVRYESYAELPLECIGADNGKFNLLQSVHLANTRLGSTKLSSTTKQHQDNYLIGVFAKGSEPSKAQMKTGICVFSMAEINAAFSTNTHRCRSGIGTRNLPHFGIDQKCRNMSHINLPTPMNECFAGQLGGTIAASKMATLVINHTLVTGITSTIVHGEHTVLFLGTSDGRIKKVVLESRGRAKEYDEVTVSDDRREPIGKDLILDGNGTHLYATTTNQVLKIPVANCQSHSSCSSCLQSRDPYCGWCTLQNKCTPKSDCPEFAIPHGWLVSAGSDAADAACPHLLSPLEPQNASLFEPMESRVRIRLNILPLVEANGECHCQFGTKSERTKARRIVSADEKHELECSLPSFTDRPKTVKGTDHSIVSLNLWSSRSNHVFHSEKFTFYDCQAHDLCTSCVSSRWGCHWCLLDNRCTTHTSNDENLCTNQTSTNGESQCPHIVDRSLLGGLKTNEGIEGKNVVNESRGMIEIASGHRTSIRLPVANLKSVFGNSGLKAARDSLECWVEIHKKRVRSPAEIIRVGDGQQQSDDGNGISWVECSPRVYEYDQLKKHHRATLYLSSTAVMSNFVIDKTQIKLYKCDEMAKDCSSCLTLAPTYGCTWCANGCRYRSLCPFNSQHSPPGGHDPSREEIVVCPPPFITGVSPTTGPVEGGTKVVITGRDLGTGIGDVRKRVFIANRVPCNVVNYEVSKKITCITSASGGEVSGEVSVVIGGRKATSRQTFTFVSPSVHGFHPTSGPKSGRTRLTVNGMHLNSATVTKVWLGSGGDEGLPCIVIPDSIRSESLQCLTTPARHHNWVAEQLTLALDWSNRTVNHRFRYTNDPVVLSVSPLESVESGGRSLTVRGLNLNTTMNPRIYYVDPLLLLATREYQKASDEKPKKSDKGHLPTDDLPPLASDLATCTAINSTVMICKSPRLQKIPAKRIKRSSPSVVRSADFSRTSALHQDSFASWPIGFKMDGVKSVQSLDPNKFSVRVLPDPEYFPFPNGEKLYRDEGDPLILEGNRLDSATEPRDVQVFIGQESCNVTLVAPNQLVCEPPTMQPQPTDAHGNRIPGTMPLVTIIVGNLEFELGHLGYASQNGLLSQELSVISPSAVGITVGIAAAILLAALVLVAIWWRKKSWQAEKEYKRIQLQMDNLESNVRMECKQAFAELQTDMSDLTSDLLALGIPFHSRRMYAAKILFKDEPHRALLLDWQQQHQQNGGDSGYSTNLQVALQQFESLLWSSEFAVTLVESLELEPTFSSEDRVYVASLLTGTLARNMEYLTGLTMDLLRGLIRKNIETKCPQLMLRRTESVVEKLLSNWIALCLYDYMQEEAGSSLFLLLKALKHQVEKGPVDAVTGDARYSLSEDRLLREQISSEPIVLNVIPSSECDPREAVGCRVLNTDTISQVKGKILDTLYRNSPYSTRPGVHDLDLEWRSPRGPILMTDDSEDDNKAAATSSSSPMRRNGTVTNGNSTKTIDSVDSWRKLNTLSYYGIPNRGFVTLLAKTRPPYVAKKPETNSDGSRQISGHHDHHNPRGGSSRYASSMSSSSTLLIPNSGHASPDSLFDSASPHNHSQSSSSSSSSNDHHPSSNNNNNNNNQGHKYWHLVRPTSAISGGSDSGRSTLSRQSRKHGYCNRNGGIYGNNSKNNNNSCSDNRSTHGNSVDDESNHSPTIRKSIPEIYLTRLLTSKGTVQKFVDDFFGSALKCQQPDSPANNSSFPIIVKFLFDFFEKEAAEHQVDDASVVYAWKNNSLPLRFWVNLIKNPDFVFDVEKSPTTVDSALSVIATTFMDACSPTEPRLGKDSPSNKLLFAKDLPRYRESVRQFYRNVSSLPPVTTGTLQAHMASLSKVYSQAFNTIGTVRELLCYVVKYQQTILTQLSRSPSNLARTVLRDRLVGVLTTMSGNGSSSHESSTTEDGHGGSDSLYDQNIYASVN